MLPMAQNITSRKPRWTRHVQLAAPCHWVWGRLLGQLPPMWPAAPLWPPLSAPAPPHVAAWHGVAGWRHGETSRPGRPGPAKSFGPRKDPVLWCSLGTLLKQLRKSTFKWPKWQATTGVIHVCLPVSKRNIWCQLKLSPMIGWNWSSPVSTNKVLQITSVAPTPCNGNE